MDDQADMSFDNKRHDIISYLFTFIYFSVNIGSGLRIQLHIMIQLVVSLSTDHIAQYMSWGESVAERSMASGL